MSRYPVPKHEGRIETRVSNSRFIATIARASSVREAQDRIRAVRAEMPDANHHVYAFRAGYGASVSEGLSDDGEPSGTAGPPTIAVLRGTDVGDVVLVITRYFGGTKLGTGGLVAAYTAAAQAVLAAMETEEKVSRVRLGVTIPYALYEPVRRLVVDGEGIVEREAFGEQVDLEMLLPEEAVGGFAAALADLTAGRIHPERLD